MTQKIQFFDRIFTAAVRNFFGGPEMHENSTTLEGVEGN